MKKILALLLALFSLGFPRVANGQDLLPFKGVFVCDHAKITFTLDAYEESVVVPSMRFLGQLQGYLSGRGIYGVWLVTSCEVKDSVAKIKLSNDTGADTQTVEFTALSDSLYEFKTVGGNELRRAEGRKLVRVANTLKFKRTR